MSIDAIAPVLARIATIEARFVQPAHQPVIRAADDSHTHFDAVFETAAADAEATPTSGVAPYASQFFESGYEHGVPPQLLAAVGYVESRYQTDAVSPTGKVGLMQLAPAIADALGIDPRDADASIDAAARLLADHEQNFGTWELALAAYHSGAAAVESAGRVPPTPASARYVDEVIERMGMS